MAPRHRAFPPLRLLVTMLTLLPATTLAEVVDLKATSLWNHTAYIPPQCYTKTADAAGQTHNPCFTCHVESRRPNPIVGDEDLQTAYALPGPALVNPWTNLFVDRTAQVAAIGDQAILDYIRQDNYADAGGPILARRLAALPTEWDVDGDGSWSGFVPDIAFRFDEQGFDIGPDGPTGWRSFAYVPVNGTFWPTNGSADDVAIRLPAIYRTAADGTPDREVYRLNLAITEALLTRRPVPIPPTDEARHGVDLDGDGSMGTALNIAFMWPPAEGRSMSWVGAARAAMAAGDAPLAAGLYPLGTEFTHSVRYLDPDQPGMAAARMKELRYMRKTRWLGYADLQEGGLKEVKERALNPDRISLFQGSSEIGISNGTGWRLQGFIEDAAGDLRPQSFEETVFCVGCHGGVGATDDSTFAFPRKLGPSAPGGGWLAMGAPAMTLRPQPVRGDGAGEIAHYLRENGAGDELRGNDEVMAAYFDQDGRLRADKVDALSVDASPVLLPSRERALALDKAYRVIVQEQSFAKGRDATVLPQKNVWQQVEQDRPTGIEVPVTPWWQVPGR